MSGRVRYHVLAQSNFDPYLTSPDPAVQSFINDHFHTIGTFKPYFDNKLPWMPRAFVYRDAYAVYSNPLFTPNAVENPDLIATDVHGNKLYIPWGPLPFSQYAGNIASPAFRQFMLNLLQNSVIEEPAAREVPFPPQQPRVGTGGPAPVVTTGTATRYQGIWLDDVNLEVRTADAQGNFVAPVDPATGHPMTSDAWINYFCQYLQLLRTSLPLSVQIIQNTLYTVPNDNQIASASWCYLERGFSDAGMTGGTGPYSVSTFMNYVDRCHIRGTAVIFGDYDVATINYSTAGYLLCQSEADMLGFSNLLPQDPWPNILSLDLGYAVNTRTQSGGLWQRDYSQGIAYLCEPGAPTTTVTLPSVMIDPDGRELSSITLHAREGAVLRYKG